MKVEKHRIYNKVSYQFNGMNIDSSLGGYIVLIDNKRIPYYSKVERLSYHDSGFEYSDNENILYCMLDFNGSKIELPIESIECIAIDSHEEWRSAAYNIFSKLTKEEVAILKYAFNHDLIK